MTELVIRLAKIDGVKVWSNPIYKDERGKLVKAFVENSEDYGDLSFRTFEHFFTISKLNVFRGLHLQSGIHPSSKIVSLAAGSATDFLLDLRSDSQTFGHLQIEKIGLEEPKSVFIPVGVAHGYISHSEGTVFSYRYESLFCSQCDSGINPILIEPFMEVSLSKLIVSERDQKLSVNSQDANHVKGH
jgi:dTDP-4-dehydrorhamnose 3,5-epimerase